MEKLHRAISGEITASSTKRNHTRSSGGFLKTFFREFPMGSPEKFLKESLEGTSVRISDEILENMSKETA